MGDFNNSSSLQSDSGAAFAREKQGVDTSGVFIGNSMDYAQNWPNRKEGIPNAAAVGRRNLLPPDSNVMQPVEVR
jgi:hypothetical protein